MLNTSVIALVVAVLFASVAEAQSPAGEQTYLEFQVHRPVRVKESSSPMYPQRLQEARVAGEVVVQFVVNDKGDADIGSLKVVKSTDREFTYAVRRAVAAARFYPAEVDGRRVRQLVQLSFKFDPK